MSQSSVSTLVVILTIVTAAAAPPAFGDQAVPVPAEPITLYIAPCPEDPDSVGCSDLTSNTIWLLDIRDRWTLAHEIGHLYLNRLGSFWQGALIDRLGFDPATTAWSDGSDSEPYCHGRRCPAEVAADAYAACALRLDPRPRRVRHGRAVATPRGWHTAYGYWPTRRKHRRICALIRRSAQP